MPVWVQYLQALTVPTIAALGIYIAWRQWLTKLKLDLFNRRLEAYRGLRDAVAPVNASGKVRNEDSDAFARAMYDMRFLFDKAMEREVEEIYDAMLKKHALDSQLDHAPDLQKAVLKSNEFFR